MRSWKKMLLSLTAAASLVAYSVPTFAAQPTEAPGAKLTVNGKPVDYAYGEVLARKGTMMVPVRLTAEALGAKLQDVQNGTVRITRNGKTVTLKDKATLIGGVSFVPVRSMAQAVGYDVHWDKATRTVVLVSTKTGEAARGFMWEVKNGPTTVYLVGSMHIADDSFYPLRSEFEKAFAEADYLGVEINIGKEESEAQEKKVMELGTYQDGTTLKDHVSAETYKELGKLLEANGIKANAFDKLKPWVVETTLGTLKSGDAGYETDEGIDLYFIQQAIQRKLPILELESYDSQLSMFNGLSDDLQERNLKGAIENFDTIAEGTDDMAKMWKSGDEKALLAMTQDIAQDPEYYKALIVDRNVGMANKIEGYLKSGKAQEYFIVVGAAHYLGKDGVLKLLEDRGYKVERK
ncbi:polysaccharide biosynthesis protein GumN [Saccharibacillus sp. O16]|nr:polysaccharide biosynthesis protein GumN [Saccharibacillus sp. O16]